MIKWGWFFMGLFRLFMTKKLTDRTLKVVGKVITFVSVIQSSALIGLYWFVHSYFSIFYDNACNLHKFFLNHDPSDCKNMRMCFLGKGKTINKEIVECSNESDPLIKNSQKIALWINWLQLKLVAVEMLHIDRHLNPTLSSNLW